MTWRTFQKPFSNYFLSPHYIARKRQEFYAIRQGNMSVIEFDCNFRHLVKHVPSDYENQQEMMYHLEIAISDEIRPYISMMQFDSYDSMFRKKLVFVLLVLL